MYYAATARRAIHARRSSRRTPALSPRQGGLRRFRQDNLSRLMSGLVLVNLI